MYVIPTKRVDFMEILKNLVKYRSENNLNHQK